MRNWLISYEKKKKNESQYYGVSQTWLKSSFKLIELQKSNEIILKKNIIRIYYFWKCSVKFCSNFVEHQLQFDF